MYMNTLEMTASTESIRCLPAEVRSQMAEWAFQDSATPSFGDKLRKAFSQGKLSEIIDRANAAYENGEALDRFC